MKPSLFFSGIFCASALISTSLQAQDSPAAGANSAASAVLAEQPAAPKNVSSLIKTDTLVGTGTEATYGSNVEVHYTGWIYNNKAADLHGAQFDSSRNGSAPFVFMLGARQVIKGWDMGVQGMKVGGKRTLIIPSYLAYSTNGSNGIPPNTHLVFDIELLNVK